MSSKIEKLRRMVESGNPHEADNARRMLEKILAKEPPPIPEKLPDPIGLPKVRKSEHKASWGWPPKGPE